MLTQVQVRYGDEWEIVAAEVEPIYGSDWELVGWEFAVEGQPVIRLRVDTIFELHNAVREQ